MNEIDMEEDEATNLIIELYQKDEITYSEAVIELAMFGHLPEDIIILLSDDVDEEIST